MGRATRDELIARVLDRQADYRTTYSRTSLRRDFKDIEALFGISIGCDRTTNQYFIETDLAAGTDETQQLRLLEAWEMQHFLGEAAIPAPYIQLDTRRGGTGTEHLRPLPRAIRAHREVRFQHRKQWDSALTDRRVWPVGLKEWAGRWYLLGFDHTRNGEFRTFGLDRMQNRLELAVPFRPPAFDADAYFRDCFGITRPPDAEPVELVLSFSWQQGRYVEDQPLHPSQTTLQRIPDDEIRIGLRVFWTHEVLMALLTYGADVAVISPDLVRRTLEEAHRAANV